MDNPPHSFHVGDRVRARNRPNFPLGTVKQLLNDGFVLVQWDGALLETAHYSDLTPSDATDAAH